MAKKKEEMQMQKFAYEIVINVGSYQSIRIGGEWSVTDEPTTEQVIKIDADLRQKVAEVVESRKASASAPQPTTEQKEEEKTENKPEPKQVDETLELVPSNSPKFQAILKKIQSGTPEEVVRKYFRFDKKGEQVIAVAYSDLIQEHGKPVEELKDKLPHKEKTNQKTQNKELPKIPNQKS